MPAIISSIMTPLIVFAAIIAVIILFKIISSNYIKVPTSKAAFFYGRKSKKVSADGKTRREGMTVISGGGKIRVPLIENVEYLDLRVITIEDLEVKNVPNRDGVKVTVQAVANVKIKSDEASLLTAAERFLGYPIDKIRSFAYQNLEAHLRGVIGKLSVEQMNSDKVAFQEAVLKEAGEDLDKVGVGIDIFAIQNISDENGYIDALGRKKTAEVVRDAEIGEAEAKRESTIRSTLADQLGSVEREKNRALAAEAKKNADIKIQEYLAATNAQTATASQAGPLAEAEAKREVRIKQIAIQEAEAREGIKVEEQKILQAVKKQEAETVVPARAKKEADVIAGEALRATRILAAEADQKEQEAQAAGEAAKERLKGLAIAEVRGAYLTKEAEGVSKLAEAYNSFSPAARMLKVMELMPALLKELPPIVSAATQHLANIDRVTILDSGSGNGGGLQKFATITPRILKDMGDTLGVDLTALLSKIGVKTEEPGKSGTETVDAEEIIGADQK